MKALRPFYEARIPVVIWGPPGVGKTASIESLAEQVGARLFVPHVRSPEDVAIPVVNQGYVAVVPVNEFAAAVDAAEKGENVIIFIDELTTLPPHVQGAILRFLDSGIIGGRRLPETVWRVAAANPPDQAAGGTDLEPPVANRLCHVEYELSPQEWAVAFPTYWGKRPVTKGRQLVAAFIASHPHMLLRVPAHDSPDRGRAWPSPRTWDFAARLIDAGADDQISSAVGEAAAAQFHQWKRKLNLPRPEEVINDPGRLPSKPDEAFVVLSALSALPDADIERNWDKLWQVAKVAASVCRDIAAGTLVPRLCRYSIVNIPRECFAPYAKLMREAGL